MEPHDCQLLEFCNKWVEHKKDQNFGYGLEELNYSATWQHSIRNGLLRASKPKNRFWNCLNVSSGVLHENIRTSILISIRKKHNIRILYVLVQNTSKIVLLVK